MTIETEGRKKKEKEYFILSSYFDTFYKYTCRAANVIYPPLEKLRKSQETVPSTIPISMSWRGIAVSVVSCLSFTMTEYN